MRNNYKGIKINTTKNTHEKVFGLISKSTQCCVADIPSGNGAFVQRLSDAGFSNVVAADIDNILEIEHPGFIQADMTKPLPFENSSVDVVVCIDGIEHINKQFDFVKEVHRVLQSGGEFILSTPNISSLRSRWKWFITGHHHKCNAPLDENNPNPLHHISMISFPELRYLLHTNGFRIERVNCNRIKPVSWLYLLFLPLVFPLTWFVYRKAAKNASLKKINKEVFRKAFSKEVLLGETIILKAVKL